MWTNNHADCQPVNTRTNQQIFKSKEMKICNRWTTNHSSTYAWLWLKRKRKFPNSPFCTEVHLILRSRQKEELVSRGLESGVRGRWLVNYVHRRVTFEKRNTLDKVHVTLSDFGNQSCSGWALLEFKHPPRVARPGAPERQKMSLKSTAVLEQSLH